MFVGTGTGVTSMVLAAIIANRWFDERRGLVRSVSQPEAVVPMMSKIPIIASSCAERTSGMP